MKKTTTTDSDEKKPRIISPEIAALRYEHKAKVMALKVSQVSAATLKRITDELLPKLTPDDKTLLLNRINPSSK